MDNFGGLMKSNVYPVWMNWVSLICFMIIGVPMILVIVFSLFSAMDILTEFVPMYVFPGLISIGCFGVYIIGALAKKHREKKGLENPWR